jgi:TonB family protein
MAAPSLPSAFDSASRRTVPRYPIDVALDVIALQSGIPNNMPGRCCDLSETGLGAVVAGELIAGQSVAIELRLPNVGLPVRARAQVRYQDRLRCGLQFVGLSVEQREKIRYWSSRTRDQVKTQAPPEAEIFAPDLHAAVPAPAELKSTRRFRVRRRRFLVLVVLMASVAVFGWWRWQKAWNELEGDAPQVVEAQPGHPVRVSGDIMDRQIIYKVDPVYPDAARQAGIQGLVVLNAVIAADGSVQRLRPLAGPEVLAQSAVDAVRSWKYTPYRAEGRAVEIETTVSVDFRLR